MKSKKWKELFVVLAVVAVVALFQFRKSENGEPSSTPTPFPSDASYAFFTDTPDRVLSNGTTIRRHSSVSYREVFTIDDVGLGDSIEAVQKNLGPTLTEVYEGEATPRLLSFRSPEPEGGFNDDTLVGFDETGQRVVYVKGKNLARKGRLLKSSADLTLLSRVIGGEAARRLRSGKLKRYQLEEVLFSLNRDGTLRFELGKRPK